VKFELEHLRDIRQAFNQRSEAMGRLCDAVKSLSASLGKAELKSWREEIGRGPLRRSLDYMAEHDPNSLRTTCTEIDLQQIEAKLMPLVEAATLASVDTPPDIQRLWDDKRVVEAARDVFKAIEIADSVGRAKSGDIGYHGTGTRCAGRDKVAIHCSDI
jgi:hypothetical protein